MYAPHPVGEEEGSGFVWLGDARIIPESPSQRVPIKYLWEDLLKGKTLEAFLRRFRRCAHEEASAALEQAYARLLEGLPHPGSVAEPVPTRSSLLTGHQGGENLP